MASRRPAANKPLPPPTPSEAAFERLLAGLGEERSESREFVDALFAKRAQYEAPERYANLGDAWEFNTKLAGVTFEGRQDIAASLQPGAMLELRRQPENPYDANAIACHYGALQVGYLNREMAAKLAPLIDGEGRRYAAQITAVTGGKSGRSWGVNVRLRRSDAARGSRTFAAPQRGAGAGGVRKALIGEHPIREPQALVLERIGSGANTLAVMGTGRGKSFCFQYAGALAALERAAKTLVVYPLRALANDQFDAMEKRLGPLGLRIFRANGAIDGDERGELMAALESGTWDIVCSTPEFVEYHVERFAGAASRPSLVVIDEVHHVYEATHRPAYAKFAATLAKLGAPQILALTATAKDDAFDHVTRELGIDAWVIDPTVRENLHVVDARGTGEKDEYLLNALDGSGKAIVYCNSRAKSMAVAERLRVAFRGEVAFYHAAMGAAERTAVERYFREGEVRIVVATSAFGEGIDLPDVRDVVLYHLSFDFTDFNQQAGRAGRDGVDARIHLLFGEADRSLNDFIIAREAPELGTLREIYRAMKDFARERIVRVDYGDVAAAVDSKVVDARTIGIAARIFEDAGLIEAGIDDEGRFVRMLEVSTRIDMTQNALFAEGQANRESFERFAKIVLSAPAKTLEQVINRPIYPQNVALLR
ncbi:MAG: DEAD/DEAH box helicase [Candidatus Eremiobacteraeota bacterium]|nr:DEAD/DEAH box helicase [Candidatus Eremiobacteraeota bacterium]